MTFNTVIQTQYKDIPLYVARLFSSETVFDSVNRTEQETGRPQQPKAACGNFWFAHSIIKAKIVPSVQLIHYFIQTDNIQNQKDCKKYSFI